MSFSGRPVNIAGLEASFHFNNEISVPKTSGAIKVAELGQPPAEINYNENGLAPSTVTLNCVPFTTAAR